MQSLLSVYGVRVLDLTEFDWWKSMWIVAADDSC